MEGSGRHGIFPEFSGWPGQSQVLLGFGGFITRPIVRFPPGLQFPHGVGGWNEGWCCTAMAPQTAKLAASKSSGRIGHSYTAHPES